MFVGSVGAHNVSISARQSQYINIITVVEIYVRAV